MRKFSLARDITISAPEARVHAIVNDFHTWVHWSPWEGLDPQLERTYSGPAAGVGSKYAWKGNSKAGQGSMEITGSTNHQVVVALTFLKPFKAENVVTFRFQPQGDNTDVTWTMTGHRGNVMSVLGKLFFDKAIGKDFERGLTQLKAHAETF